MRWDRIKIGMTIQVDWIDASGRSGWQPFDAKLTPIMAETRGMVTEVTDEYVTITGTNDTERVAAADKTTVPVEMIKGVRQLK